jgi:catechol 2,3-dioxygenase
MTSSAPSLHPATALGPVRLVVADLPGVAVFYKRAVGLHPLERNEDAGSVVLGTPGGKPLVELVGRADAPPRARGSSGLFHLALLLPSRAELALALRRLAAAGWPLDGASDHLVSEALYVSDPEGNGIEIYRDRPREQWGRERDGQLRMATLPLDLDALAAELPAGARTAGDAFEDAGLPDDARMGHVHLSVADLDAAERFYHGVLGFDVVVRGYPGALFVSAGGYHHHLGLNTWASADGPPNRAGTRGLARFEIVLAGAAELRAVGERLAAAGMAAEQTAEGLVTTDPFGNELLLSAGAEADR